MQLLQVKQYHSSVAIPKYNKRLEDWKKSDTLNGYPCKSMYMFEVTDSRGFAIKLREKGYIAFNDNKAVYGSNRDKAINNFNNLP